jgi:hypothetical protein
MIKTPTHDDKFSHDPKVDRCIKDWRGFQIKKLYAWVESDGTLIGQPDEDYEKISALEEQMQKYSDDNGCVVRLIELKFKETKVRLIPPPDPEDEQFRGGCAIGGSTPRTIEDVLEEFKRIFAKQYLAQDVKFWVEGDTAHAEYKNVRCWVKYSKEPLGRDVEYGSNKHWSAYVTMIEMWNDEYHDVHLGNYYSGTIAVEEAFIAFVSFQITEQDIEDSF